MSSGTNKERITQNNAKIEELKRKFVLVEGNADELNEKSQEENKQKTTVE